MKRIVIRVEDDIPERLNKLLKSSLWNLRYESRDDFLREIILKALKIEEGRAKDRGLI